MTLQCKYAEAEMAVIGDEGAISGYASLFGVTDLSGEAVARGAFQKTLADKGASGVRMLFQHDPDEPIGSWIAIEEDERGLAVTGKIDINVARGREVLSLIRCGALDGLSIGFKTVKAHSDQKTDTRTITEADLWEISIVTFPMLPQARVSDVKSYDRLPTRRSFERWLVRDAGFSRSQARTIISKGFGALQTGAERDAGDRVIDHRPADGMLLNMIQRATQSMRT
ncbi:MAG: HK97 family phage prohead protease [Pseudomonadota bacterium]